MTKNKKNILNNCTQEELINIIGVYESIIYNASMFCVSESKQHLSSENAIKKIKEEIKRIQSVNTFYLSRRDSVH